MTTCPRMPFLGRAAASRALCLHGLGDLADWILGTCQRVYRRSPLTPALANSLTRRRLERRRRGSCAAAVIAPTRDDRVVALRSYDARRRDEESDRASRGSRTIGDWAPTGAPSEDPRALASDHRSRAPALSRGTAEERTHCPAV